MSKFIHLHTHSDYSNLDGCQTTDIIAEKAAKLGMNSVALTDHGKAGGLLSFKKSCEKHDIKPIYGIELYVAPKSRLLKEKLDDHIKTSYHLTILAKNEEGLRNIFRLSSTGWTEGFYYRPRIDLESLQRLSEGLVVLSGCAAGRVSHFLSNGLQRRARDHVGRLRDIFQDDFYIEVQNHGFDWQQPLKKSLFQLAKTMDIPIVATQDSHYNNREDAELHRAICRLAAGDLEFEGDQSYFKSYEEMCEMFRPEERHAIDFTQEIADKCNCNWEYGKTIWPVYDLPRGKTPDQELRDKTYAGLAERFKEVPEGYTDRIESELKIISDMGFATYFLVVADFIDFARGQSIPCGPGRGSGSGSLVCYCLKITQVDPIKYGLYFERFLNPHRVSNPDLDLDFCKRRRGEVLKYVADKYGADKVSQIGTLAVFKPRGALRDFARVLGHSPNVGNKLANIIPPDVAGKSLTWEEVIESVPDILHTEHPEVVELARKSEKLKSKPGVHAAGVVISNTDLASQVPLFLGKHNEVATQFDMNDIEEIGLVKYDFLGLKNLTVIQDTIDLVKKTRGISIDINNISDDDQRVFREVFQQGRLDGVFQFETSSGFKDLCVQVKPKSIQDLSAVTSIFRPGPLATKATDKYIKGRRGGKVEYLMPELEPMLKDTYGIMVFQEQVMRICTDVAGYTLPESDNVRKLVGKKLTEKMKAERSKFVSRCVNNSISKSNATKLFDDIEGYAKYSFCLSHATAYSIISYQTAYLKHYYLPEFCVSLLNNSLNDQDDLVKYIYMCKDEEIPVLPPDVNRSGAQFTLDNGTILFGLAGVKGLGVKACEILIDRRPAEGYNSLQSMVTAKINKGIIKALSESGALEEITELTREQLVENIEPLIEYYQKLASWQERNTRIAAREAEIAAAALAGQQKLPRRLPKNREEPQMPEVGEATSISKRDKLALERKTLGFYLTGHPIDDFPGLLEMAGYTIEELLEGKAMDSETVSLPAVISSLTKIRTKKGKDMAVLVIEDKTGHIEATIFPNQWRKLKGSIEEDSVNVIKGAIRVIAADSEETPPLVRIIVNDVKPVSDDSSVLSIHPLEMTLNDGTIVKFIPAADQNYSKWQRAVAIINNLQRMG